jgi:hypothetical protein
MLNHHPTHSYGVGYYFREIGLTDSVGLFNFTGSVKNFRFEAGWDESTRSEFNRCDNAATRDVYLPSGFHRWDYDLSVCSCGSTSKPYGTTNDHYTCLTHCSVFRVPIQTQKGFIVYLEYKNSENESLNIERSDCSGRTLQEIFRCILEWQWVHLHMNNTELVAISANEFINEINMPQELIDWLWDATPDQHVAKYLRGEVNPRVRNELEDIPDMSDEFNLWLDVQITQTPNLWPYGPR